MKNKTAKEETVENFIDILSSMTHASKLKWTLVFEQDMDQSDFKRYLRNVWEKYGSAPLELTPRIKEGIDSYLEDLSHLLFQKASVREDLRAVDTFRTEYGGGFVWLHRHRPNHRHTTSRPPISVFILELEPKPGTPRTKLNTPRTLQAELVRLYTLIENQTASPQDYMSKFFSDTEYSGS